MLNNTLDKMIDKMIDNMCPFFAVCVAILGFAGVIQSLMIQAANK